MRQSTIKNLSENRRCFRKVGGVLVEKDLAILVDEEKTWSDISKAIKASVKELEFIDEYRGEKIPKGKKSITLRIKLLNEGTTMTSEQINEKVNDILKSLNKKCGVILREE